MIIGVAAVAALPLFLPATAEAAGYASFSTDGSLLRAVVTGVNPPSGVCYMVAEGPTHLSRSLSSNFGANSVTIDFAGAPDGDYNVRIDCPDVSNATSVKWNNGLLER
ncbi:hypothetical protein [Antrihabitans stalactiti]|uniref:Uncharacterized protein n=1 Tax=Antrihabitans stalactiti TaxID=2584121 RepID=A0A848KJL8_9NOCA|nr:hypothetical protein [Antrihabitans stalactiti]NMN98311.1 hypothetical protein [Antrihabitans stalactiti]